MAYPIHGKVCRVEKGAVLVAGSQGWTINTSLDLDEVTAQGANWKKFVAGCAEWDGSMELNFDPSNTEQLALLNNIVVAAPGTLLTDVEFNLEDDADYFSGDLYVIGCNVPTNVAGKVSVTFNFKGNDALALTIA